MKIQNRTTKAIRYVQYIKDMFSGNGVYASKYRFINRKKDSKKLLYVLAGYKPYLWEDVFSRINAFCPEDVEVCILSSGRHVEELEKYCERYSWSYLSTTRNNICCITNIMMRMYDKAEYIYKMDEDIYLTKNAFEGLLEVYEKVLAEGRYEVGMVGAYIPINSFCIYKFLEKEGKLEDFITKFGWFNDGCMEDMFRDKTGINAYIWKCTGNIDEYAEKNKSLEPEVYNVNVRYMIGFVLFKRTLWENIGGLRVSVGKGSGTEGDEGQLLTHCFLASKVILCAKNVIVGHFSYGGSEGEVLALRKQYPEWFRLKEKK